MKFETGSKIRTTVPVKSDDGHILPPSMDGHVVSVYENACYCGFTMSTPDKETVFAMVLESQLLGAS